MSWLQTPTPPYRQQPANGDADRNTGRITGWLTSLLRTPTPDYKRDPVIDDREALEQGDEQRDG
jgi:hypothetical protein